MEYYKLVTPDYSDVFYRKKENAVNALKDTLISNGNDMNTFCHYNCEEKYCKLCSEHLNSYTKYFNCDVLEIRLFKEKFICSNSI